MFEAFAERGKPMTLSELSRLLRIPTSTCFGLMRTLQARGYLYEVGGRKTFYPTSRWLIKARKIESSDPIQEHLKSYLEKLRDETGESVILSKQLGDAVVYLNIVESTQTVRYSAGVGEIKPFYSTSSGKALMSTMPALEREGLLSRMRGRGGARLSASHRAQLIDEIEHSAKRGWFVGRGENVVDVMGVAVPLYVGEDVFGVGVAGPMSRMEPKLQSHAKQLVGICRAFLKK